MLRYLVVLLLVGSTNAAQSRTDVRPEPPPPAGRVIAEFHQARTATAASTFQQFRRDLATLDRRAAKTALDPIRHQYVHAMFGAAIDVAPEVVHQIRRLPYIRAVHPDLTFKTCVERWAPRPPAFATTAAIALPTRGEGITVAVVDSGIDYRHPALGGAFGPGHKVAGGWDFVNGDADPLDDHGHGTHVAGIIAGDSAELTGVAPGVTLFAYKVLNGMGHGLQSDILAAIERSIDPNQDGNPSDHFDVINMSLGGLGTADDPVSLAVDKATAAGVTVVVSAGNESQLSSVRSPGTARTAITVGAVTDSGAMTSFSSRGPAPALLTFKPDVVAPGYEILSARLGGGLIRYSGTSMAAPYVAGVAALLASLHPDWTPADIRSALVTTAVTTADSPVARGAGRVDAIRAAAATARIDSSGISFGLAAGTTGEWEERRVVTVTNRAAAARTFQVVATNGPSGATLTATPAVLQLAPGASEAVELKLTINNAAVAFPDEPALSGIIEFRGDESFQLPWIVMRAARSTISFEAFVSGVAVLSASGTKWVAPYAFGRAELFGRPGTTSDIVVTAGDMTDLGPTFYLLVAEDRTLAGDGQIALVRADASAELALHARDEHGRLQTDLARERGHTGHWATLTLDFDRPRRELFTVHIGSWGKIFLTPMSSRIALHAFEVAIDMSRERVYNIQYPVLQGITGSKTFDVDASSYVHTTLHFATEAPPPHVLVTCLGNAVQTGPDVPQLYWPWCFTDVSERPVSVRYYSNMESANGASAIQFHLQGSTVVPPLRGIGGSLVAAEAVPSPADYHIADGEELTFGATALFPMTFYGTTAGVRPRWLQPGFHGPAGEWNITATQGTPWTIYDAQNAVKSTGAINLYTSPDQGPEARPGDRLVAVREGLKVAGLPSRAELEVRFGTDETDLTPPTFSSLRVVDAQGRIADRLRRSTAAALYFSAADLDYNLDARAGPMKSEATRVWYRPSGAAAWQPLSVAYTGSDTGAFLTLGRVPAGDLYRIDLFPATANAGAIDLRIEVEDARGNRTTWTQAPAFVVSTARRRSVR